MIESTWKDILLGFFLIMEKWNSQLIIKLDSTQFLKFYFDYVTYLRGIYWHYWQFII